MLPSIQIKILDDRLGRDFPMPDYATSGSAGLDLMAMVKQPLTLEPGQVELVSAGLSIFIKDQGYAAMILARSGLGHKHGIVLGNQVGLIDADYQGPLMISMCNRGHDVFVIEPGQRVAQLVFVPIARPLLTVVDDFEATARGQGGFGSTGIASIKQEANAS